VISVEPDPENYDLLVRNLKLNNSKNFGALNIAAGDRRARLHFIGGRGQTQLHIASLSKGEE